VSDAKKKKKILLVEDEDNLRELVQSRLENEGFEVVPVVDGFQALARARQSQPDLIILDLMIPKMDGYSICRLLKSGGMGQTPIIMFSARSSPDDIQRGLDMGASAYVTKPFDAPVLLGKIRELLFPEERAKEQAAPPPEPTPAPEPVAAAANQQDELKPAGQPAPQGADADKKSRPLG